MSNSKSFAVVPNAHDESEGAGKAPKQAGGGRKRRPVFGGQLHSLGQLRQLRQLKAAMTRLKSDARKGSSEAKLMS